MKIAQKPDAIIFDFAGTLVKMRPVTLLVPKIFLTNFSRKYKLYILTGAKRPETLNILKKLSLDQIFSPDNVVTKDDTNFQKPNPRLLSFISKKFSLTSPLYFGDSYKDAIMAIKVGAYFISSNVLQKSPQTINL